METKYISFEELDEKCRKLAKLIKDSNEKYDIIVSIYRGGVPISLIIADELGMENNEIIKVKSYEKFERKETKILSKISENLDNKRVLIVDDLVDSGRTLIDVVNYIKENFKVKKIDSAVIFKKSWSKVNPTYYVEETDKWIVFPWERREYEGILNKDE